MFNFKALVKTFSFNLDNAKTLGLALLLVAGVFLFGAFCVGLMIGLSLLLLLFFSEATVTTIMLVLLGVLPWTWWLIIEPLIVRYKRIKRELEREAH